MQDFHVYVITFFWVTTELAEVGTVQGAWIWRVGEKSFCAFGAHSAPETQIHTHRQHRVFILPGSLWNNKLLDLDIHS